MDEVPCNCIFIVSTCESRVRTSPVFTYHTTSSRTFVHRGLSTTPNALHDSLKIVRHLANTLAADSANAHVLLINTPCRYYLGCERELQPRDRYMILITVSACDGHYTCEHISFLSMIVQSAVKFSNAEENTIFQSLCPSDYEEGLGFPLRRSDELQPAMGI